NRSAREWIGRPLWVRRTRSATFFRSERSPSAPPMSRGRHNQADSANVHILKIVRTMRTSSKLPRPEAPVMEPHESLHPSRREFVRGVTLGTSLAAAGLPLSAAEPPAPR